MQISMRKKPGFTLLEMLVAMAVLAILSMSVVATIGNIRKQTDRTQTIVNLRSIGAALLMFQSDNDGDFPTLCQEKGGWNAPYWTDSLAPYLPMSPSGLLLRQGPTRPVAYDYFPTVLSCPLVPLESRNKNGEISDFGANRAVFSTIAPVSTLQLTNPAKLMAVMTATRSGQGGQMPSWFVEAGAFAANPSSDFRPHDWGTGFVYAVFADGHADAIAMDDLRDRPREYLMP